MPRRPQKRRRLSTTTTTTTSSLADAATGCMWPRPAPADTHTLVRAFRDSADLSCTSCRRSLAASSIGGASYTTKRGQLVVCPRCQATSCAICSRTCTSVPPSLPPTPLLSFSPSPSPSPPGTPLGPLENRLLPLPSSHDAPGVTDRDTPRARAHTHTALLPGAGGRSRRRKHREPEDDDEGTVVGVDDYADAKDGFNGNSNGNGYSNGTGTGAGAGARMFLPGCGRTLCKNCCFENAQTGTTTCYECYGLPPPPPSQAQTQDQDQYCHSDTTLRPGPGRSLPTQAGSPSMAMTPLLI
ncbi:hypothetical protein M0805_007766 [Coniferiporia weirii]|nr:hypothetical protein M0805_007766 [Coniferiporia weirii]